MTTIFNNKPANNGKGILTPLAKWSLSTIPTAIVLILFQAVGIPAARAAEASAEQIVPSTSPSLPGQTTSHQVSSDGSMTFLGEDGPPSPVFVPPPSQRAVSTEQQAAVLARAKAQQHHFRTGRKGLNAVHPALAIDLHYDEAGMRIEPHGSRNLLPPPDQWSATIAFHGIELDGQPLESSARPPKIGSQPHHATQRVANSLQEWWHNADEAPEHGFTLEAIDQTDPSQLRISLDLETSLHPIWDHDQEMVRLEGEDGRTRLTYKGLYVHDAEGRELPSRMSLNRQGEDWVIFLEADIKGAEFPVTVDPVIGNQQEETLASDGAPGDEFGFASDGLQDVVAVSAPGKGSGKVYLFHENEGGAGAWNEKTSVVVPANQSPGTLDRFGESIALFHDELTAKTYLAVGSPGHAGTGSIFIFERNEGGTDNWGFLQFLQDPDLSEGDHFGGSVDGLGDTLIVGAKDQGAGAVYVFDVSSGTFVRNQKLTTPPGSTPGANDEFGAAVAIGGDHLIVGAPGENSEEGGAYLFKRSSPFVALFRLFTDKAEAGARFGAVVAIAITGLLLAIGMPFDDRISGSGELLVNAGAVFVYALLAATLTWGFLTARFGSEAGALFGTALVINYFFDLVVGAPGARSTASAIGGAVFVFLFSRLLFSYDGGSKVVPSTFIDVGMALGTSIILLGSTLFVLGVAYSASMGAMFRFTLVSAFLTFALWQLLFWTQDQIDTQPEITGKDGDPNGNNISNEFEHVFGLDPTIATVLPVVALLLTNGTYQFVFQQSLAVVGVLLLIQYSLSISAWFLLGSGPLANGFTVNRLNGGIQTQQLQVTISSLLALTLFIRLATQAT